MNDAKVILTNLLARELESINEALEADHEEWLTETDWMPKKERALTYKTRPIDKYEGNERYWLNKKRLVQRRLYEAANLWLERGGK